MLSRSISKTKWKYFLYHQVLALQWGFLPLALLQFVTQVRVVPDQHTSAVRWVDVDFRLGRVRDGSHKDCWLVERAIVRAWGGSPVTTHV